MEWCCYIRSEQEDLLYAYAKDLIQSWRIYNRVALSLVFFRLLSVLVWGRLISYINIYHLFAGHQNITSFSLQFVLAGGFVFGGDIWHFQIWKWRNLVEASRKYSQHKIIDLYLSSMSWTACSQSTVEEYKHTHTHTHRERERERERESESERESTFYYLRTYNTHMLRF